MMMLLSLLTDNYYCWLLSGPNLIFEQMKKNKFVYIDVRRDLYSALNRRAISNNEQYDGITLKADPSDDDRSISIIVHGLCNDE